MVTIYGTPNCRYCSMSKQFLNAKGVPFEYVDISLMSDRVALEVKLGATVRSVPQIFIDDVHLPKGYAELVELY